MELEAFNSYHNVNLAAQASRASPVQLIVMLNDGLLEELARARAHIHARRYQLKAKSINRCVAILNGLAAALDTEAGGELVVNLQRLYDYCSRRLHTAGVKMDVGLIDEVSRLITTLRAGWQGYLDRHGHGSA